MAKLPPCRRRRWHGPPLGGPLRRGCRFCFAAHDGEVTTSRLAEWLRPEIVYSDVAGALKISRESSAD
jgi:hypothetical protein